MSPIQRLPIFLAFFVTFFAASLAGRGTDNIVAVPNIKPINSGIVICRVNYCLLGSDWRLLVF